MSVVETLMEVMRLEVPRYNEQTQYGGGGVAKNYRDESAKGDMENAASDAYDPRIYLLDQLVNGKGSMSGLLSELARSELLAQQNQVGANGVPIPSDGMSLGDLNAIQEGGRARELMGGTGQMSQAQKLEFLRQLLQEKQLERSMAQRATPELFNPQSADSQQLRYGASNAQY